jgi:glycosyltransferase involved in cell wall biosynthesis
MHRGIAGQLLSFLTFASSSLIAGLRVKDVDVVLATTPPIFQAVTAWLVAVIHRRPLILEIRDLWPEFIIDMGKLRNPLVIALARRLERFLYDHADGFIVNSPAYVGYLEGKGVEGRKITLIPNGVSPEMFAGDPIDAGTRDVKARYGLSDKFVVMYAGAMGPANDLDVLLDAAEQLRDDENIHVVLVGDGKARKQLEASARTRALSNVTFVGPQSKTEMRAFLDAANVCVATLQNIAMFRMTYPNKVFDYLAAGKPIVASNPDAHRWVLAEDRALLVEHTPAALARGISAVLSDPGLASRLSAGARAFADSRLHAAGFVEAVGEIYEGLRTRAAAPTAQR